MNELRKSRTRKLKVQDLFRKKNDMLFSSVLCKVDVWANPTMSCFLYWLAEMPNSCAVFVSCPDLKKPWATRVIFCDWSANDALTGSRSSGNFSFCMWRSHVSKCYLWRGDFSQSCLLKWLNMTTIDAFIANHCPKDFVRIFAKRALGTYVGGGPTNIEYGKREPARLWGCKLNA